MILLDLFCGAGLAAWGYWRSGKFSTIVGVDTEDFANVYPFDFIQTDALTLDYDFLAGFSFIHASPPCQAYSRITPRALRASHPRLILPTRALCAAASLPHVIENVEGSSRELAPNLRLRGHEVGLPFNRPRYFRVSFGNISTGRNINNRAAAYPHGLITRQELINIMFAGDEYPARYTRKLTVPMLEQGIPPAMTRFIADHIPAPILRCR